MDNIIPIREELIEIIRTERKKYNWTANKLSKAIGKSDSYITQIENGNVNNIIRENLDNIFKTITDLEGEEFANYIETLLEDVFKKLSTKERDNQEWMLYFDQQRRKIPIPNTLIEFIETKLNELNITPKELTQYINENEEIDNPSEYKYPNQIKIDTHDDKRISFSIFLELKYTLIGDILSKKKTSINYITMYGIIYHIFKSKESNQTIAQTMTRDILYQNNFLTLTERVKKIEQLKEMENNDIKFYDYLPTEHEQKYAELYKTCTQYFSFIRDINIEYAIRNLSILNQNLNFDRMFMFAVFALPFHKLVSVSSDNRKKLFNDIKSLIQKYKNEEEQEQNNEYDNLNND